MLTSLKEGRLGESVLAVPPLCRLGTLSVNETENRRLIRHIEAGGITTLLYGGNANFYHVGLEEYGQLLGFLSTAGGDQTLVIPSAGPAFGTMMDQAKLLRKHRFPIVMILPQQGITTSRGVETGIRRFVEAAGTPTLLYIKHEGYIEPENAAALVKDGVVRGIKYAIVRSDPARDSYLGRLMELVDRRVIISGIGEQPAITHLRAFGLGGFTSGCVCVAPALSARMLAAIRAGRWEEAERVREIFKPLEDLRNSINPIKVLHEAVRLAGIADTGPLQPLLSNLEEEHHAVVRRAAETLVKLNA